MTAGAGIVGVVSCPQPPLLLPGVTGGPVAEVERLRTACLAALADLVAERPDELVLVGGVTPAEAAAGRRPDSLAVGEYLAAGAGLPVRTVPVPVDADPQECLALGRQLAGSCRSRTGLLVLADGSARRGPKAPGYLDDRAAPFDRTIGAALAAGDPAGLAALDAGLAAELMVAGRAAWQVLAGAVAGRRFAARQYYDGDPFGVWYPVVRWS